MAAPRHLATGGFGTTYVNYGSHNRYLAEPNILTKFFASARGQMPQTFYNSERDAHIHLENSLVQGQRNAPVNPSIRTIIGLGTDTQGTLVSSRRLFFTVYPEARHRPENGPYFTLADGMYPVFKFPFLGRNFWGSNNGEGLDSLTFDTFINVFETFVLFHAVSVHNDMKMNNILFDSVTRKVAIIDLGECKRFVQGANPWAERDFQGVYVWSYPPDLCTHSQGKGVYSRYFQGGARARQDVMGWPAERRMGIFTAWKELAAVNRMLETVYDDYFAVPAGFDNKRALWIGVTTDLYGFASTLEHSIRSLPAQIRNTTYIITYDAADGQEFSLPMSSIIRRLQILLTHIHPRMRPLDYTLVKFFKIMNPDLGAGQQTMIRAGANNYMSVSVLAGNPARIDVRADMAYGAAGSPITAADLQDNMKVFAYLITIPSDRIIDYFSQRDGGGVYTKLIFANVLADAEAYLRDPMFVGKPLYVALGLVAAGQGAQPPRRAARLAAPPPAPPLAPEPAPRAAVRRRGTPQRQVIAAPPAEIPPQIPAIMAPWAERQRQWREGGREGDAPRRGAPVCRRGIAACANFTGALVPAVPAGFIAGIVGEFLGRGVGLPAGWGNLMAEWAGGGAALVAVAPRVDEFVGNYVYGANNVFDAVGLAAGNAVNAYISYVGRENHFGGAGKRTRKRGGRLATMRPMNMNNQRNNSMYKNTMKKRMNNKKLNTVTSNNSSTNTYPMLDSKMYGKDQSDLITNNLVSSTPSGILNIFHQYYISDKPEIFKLLLKIPTYEPVPLLVIQELLDSQNYEVLNNYLNEYIQNYQRAAEEGGYAGDNFLNEVGVEMITTYYYGFAENDERYKFLHDFFDNIPENADEVRIIAKQFVETDIGKNPFMKEEALIDAP